MKSALSAEALSTPALKAATDSVDHEVGKQWYRDAVATLIDEAGLFTWDDGTLAIESITSIPGPGNCVVVFWTIGDCHVACLSHELAILWVVTCGGSLEGGNSVIKMMEPRANVWPDDED